MKTNAYLQRFLMVAGIYIFAAVLSVHFLLMPPSVVPMVWAPAGIALGAVLVFGWRMLPVVPFSLFLSSVLNGLMLGSDADLLRLSTVAGIIALGGTLQTAVGVALFSRLLSLRERLDTRSELLIGLAFCIPLSCAVGPTVGTIAMAFSNTTPAEGVGNRWLGWWFANILGCAVFVPAAFALAARPREVWKPRITSVVLPLLVTLAAGVWVIKSANDWRIQQVAADFNQLSSKLGGALYEQLKKDETLLEGLGKFVASNPNLSESDFRNYTESLLGAHASIQAFEWLPQQGERAIWSGREVEAAASFRGAEQGASGYLSAADLYRTEPFREALERSLINPGAALTNLSYDSSGNPYLLLLRPVFTASGAPQNRQLRGVVTLRYNIERMVTASWRGSQLQKLDVAVDDVTAAAHSTRLFDHLSRLRVSGKDNVIKDQELGWQGSMTMAGRIWRLRIRAKASWFLNTQQHENTLFQLLTALLLNLLCGFLLYVSGRRTKVAVLVKERTQALDAANKRMQVLLAEREQALRTSEQREIALKRSNKELEQYAYVVSHDLKSPLRSMQGFSDLLQKRYADQLDAKGLELFGYISQGAERMTGLLDDLLMLSQVESSGKKLRPVLSDRVLQTVLQDFDAAIRESGAVVCMGKLPRVLADESQLRSLLANLIGNAIKYRFSNRAPKIFVGAVYCAKLDQWVFEVRDNGIGMEPAYFEQVFVLFKRLHHGQDYEGTGIGLSLCKKIVERHSGKIWVESSPGQGSSFFFTLPVVIAPAVSPNRLRSVIDSKKPAPRKPSMLMRDDLAKKAQAAN